ncbi:MAG: cell division protein FtsL [Thiotrichales bacterium]
MKWQIGLIGALGLLMLLSAMGVVTAKHEHRKQFQLMAQQERLRDQLEIEWRQLLLEQRTHAKHDQIESEAARKLSMKIPRMGDTVMVLR